MLLLLLMLGLPAPATAQAQDTALRDAVYDLLDAEDPGAADLLAQDLVLRAQDSAAEREARLLLALARADLGQPAAALAAVLPLLPLDTSADAQTEILWQALADWLDAVAGEAGDAALDGWMAEARTLADADHATEAQVMAALGDGMAARDAGGATAFDRVMRGHVADLPPGHPLVRATDLALLVATLAEGRPDLAATWAARVAALPAPVLALSEQDMVPPLREVAEWLQSEGRLPEALALAEAVAVLSPLRDGPGSEAVGRALVLLAAIQTDMGRLVQAGATLDLLRDGAGHAPRIAVLAALERAALETRAGRMAQAGTALGAAVTLLETTPEGDGPDAWLTVLDTLGEHQAAQGDAAAALATARRLVAELDRRAAPDAPERAAAARILARRQVAAGVAPLAELGPLQPPVQGMAGALPPLTGPGLSPEVAPLVQTAQTLRDAGDLAGALARMDQALALTPAAHPMRAALLSGRGLMRLESGAVQAALDDLRPATAELSQPDRRDEGLSRQALGIHVAAAMAAAAGVTEAEGDSALLNLLTEAFQVAQRVNDLRAGEVLGRATARLYGDDDLGRAREAAATALARAQAAMVQALAQGGDSGNARARLTRARSDLAGAEAALSARFPDYGAFAAARPVDLLSAARLLRPDEALILFASVDGDAVPGRVFVLTEDDFDSAELPPRAEVAALAHRLRCAAALTDPSCGPGGAGTRGAFTLEPEDDTGGFDTTAATEAWQVLLAPVADILVGRESLIVVPDRTLVALPFHLLARGVQDGRVDWLIRDHAITVMPNVAGLARLRDGAARRVAAAQPFLGVGDPLIGAARGGALPYDCASPPGSALMAALSLSRGVDGLADPARIADLPALPDTRCELEAAARLFGTPEALMIQDRATEAGLKALSDAGRLAEYRVLSFATHGLIAGEIGAGDAALVLTPPARATELDDGLLTAAEIAQLRLDADLVILSACNTAAGSDGGEGLSGLASGFFLAGARSLLVSHWPVYSDAATRLTEAMLTGASTQGTRAQALRHAMLALADDPGADARQRHPAYWAPFMLVGDSGL